MRTSNRSVKMGIVALGMLGLLVTLGVAGASSAGTAPTSAVTKVGGTFNFSSNGPVWNSGNLCAVNTSGSAWNCTYPAPSTGSSSWGGHHFSAYVAPACGTCTPSLIYNFSANSTTINVDITSLSGKVQHIYLNFHGDYNTININVSGCTGGALNVTIVGEHNVVNVQVGASSVSATFLLLLDNYRFHVNETGSWDSVYATMSGAAVKQNACPWANSSRTDTFTAVAWGWKDYQQMTWVNTNNYNTNLSFTPMAGSHSSWSSNWVGWENTTSLVCHWAIAPACSTGTHHHSGWVARRAD